MKAAVYTVNQTGLREIAEFLGENHKDSVKSGKGSNYWTDNMLAAWAAYAEFQLDEGNPATIEIGGMHSITGNPICYTISDAGLDAHEIEVEE